MTLAIWSAQRLIFRVAMAVFTLLLFNSAVVAQTPKAGGEIVIVTFGDSLSAGFQLPPNGSFPAQLQKALELKGYDIRVENAAVSGDTASDGNQRFDWAVPDKADAIIVELGGNDALRGINPAETEKALDGILTKAKARGMAILLAGMEAPRNMGPDYVEQFRGIFPRLAEKHGTLLYPFFLDGVATKPELNLPDGIHPKVEGIGVIVTRILPKVEELIARVKARRAGTG